MKKLLFAVALMMSSFAHAEGTDESAVWTEIGIEKSLSKQWSVGLESEYRAQNKSRWGIGLGLGYKPSKYFKMGASYTFLYSNKPDQITKRVYDDDELISWRETPAYWSPRHRLGVEATGTMKLWKWLRISVRERYQFTHKASQTIDRVDVEKTEMFTPDGMVTEWDRTDNPKEISCQSDQVLRSRLKLEVDKKGLAISPFVSAEAHNSVAVGNKMNLEKVRTSLGMGYKINKKNEISVAYVLTFNIHDDEGDFERIHERVHAVNVGYKFDF